MTLGHIKYVYMTILRSHIFEVKKSGLNPEKSGLNRIKSAGADFL